MIDANGILDAAHETSCKAASLGLDLHTLTGAVVADVLRELAKRPEDWNRYELADLADEIEGANDD